MHKKFDHNAIEKKWQEKWRADHLYDVTDRDASKEKKYILVEFPYPSGNLHIGHWFAFTPADMYGRFQRMQGKQVFFPIGFDSFGLPAENAAIKRGINPKTWTYENIATMTKQLESMGNAFAWNASLRTSDPEYFKWTQWMFTQFFKNDIVYRGEANVNWCPTDNTVLANEQVVDGKCERCGSVVEQKRMQQWMMRITNYADRLIDDLADLPWPEHIKNLQKNWIGRSEGSELSFKLSTGDDVKVFTTRADTLFGATYLVLAPDHTLLTKIKESISNWDQVRAYQETTAQKKDIERTAEGKEKTGVELKGITAINPATKEHIPVYIADYVLAHYGTGAIMAVPAHDDRDLLFAKKYNLPLRRVIRNKDQDPLETIGSTEAMLESGASWSYDGVLMNSGEFDGLSSKEGRREITESVGGKMTKTYKLRDWSMSRQRYWGVPIPIVYDPEGKPHPIPKEHLPWLLPEDVDFTPTGEAPLAKSAELKERTEKIFGAGWRPEVETMDTFVDSAWYFLRYLDAQNENEFASLEAQKAWMPVDIYFGGAEHTTMHLLYSRFWQKALKDLGLSTLVEPYKIRINRGLVLGPDGQKMSKSKGNVVDPDEQVDRLGADTVRMYLAFMGPYGESTNYPWDMGGIAGLRRFLERVNGLADHVKAEESKDTTKLLHETIKKVTRDMELYKFNTAISALMILLNATEKDGLTKVSYLSFLQLLAPFAPHLSEELWSIAEERESIHQSRFPVADEGMLVEHEVTVAVQFNGKTRSTVRVPKDSPEADVVALVMKNPHLQSYHSVGGEGGEGRVVYIPNKIINFVGK